MNGNQVGVLVGGTFGLVYVLVNASSTVLQVLAVTAFVALVALLVRGRRSGAGGPPRFDRGYWLVVLVEVVAIVVGAQVCNALGLPPLPWVTVVVGLHFLPLARMWANPALGVVGAVLAALGAAGLVVAVAGGSAAVATVAGVVPGVVLLAAALWGAAWAVRVPAR